MKTLILFLIFGALGWCMEIIWTGIGSLFRGDFRLIANTSLWMFFIYGLAAFIGPVSRMMEDFPLVLRGLIYVVIIFGAEFVTGYMLSRFSVCPWNYEAARFNIKGLIRLDYAPAWFVAGLLMESVYKWMPIK